MDLKLWPTGAMGESWHILVFTDSDYVGDPVSWRGVSVYIFTYMGYHCVDEVRPDGE